MNSPQTDGETFVGISFAESTAAQSPPSKELRLFHVACFLHGYEKSKDRYLMNLHNFRIHILQPLTSRRPILSPGFLEETARTLSLLITSSNLKCQRWIRKARRNDDIDLEAAYLPPTSRDLADFPHWRRQLMELQDEYKWTELMTVDVGQEEAEPAGYILDFRDCTVLRVRFSFDPVRHGDYSGHARQLTRRLDLVFTYLAFVSAQLP